MPLKALAETDRITDFADWAEAQARDFGCSDETLFAVRLCVEEAVTNVVVYAFDADHSDRAMEIEAVTGGDSIIFHLTDRGRPFDVTKRKDDPPEYDIETAAIGGRGIKLMRSFSTHLAYERAKGCNRLSLEFSKAVPAPDR